MNYDLIPEHMRDGVRLYLEDGIIPGDFLYAVLCNKLVEAHGRADGINAAAMRDWVSFLYNEMPMNAWGSEEKVLAYVMEIREKRAAGVRP